METKGEKHKAIQEQTRAGARRLWPYLRRHLRSYLFGALMLVPMAALEGFTLRLSVEVWVALLGLALGSGAAANWLWWSAVERLPVSRAGVFLYVTPVVSTILGVAVLGEPLTLATLAGAGFVIGGVMLVQLDSS